MRWTAFLTLAFAIAMRAQGPSIIAIGSPITYGGANTPDTFTASSTFGPTPVLVNNGRVRIWQEQVATGANGEWDIFRMETTNGGPLAGNLGAEWNIVVSYTLTRPAIFDGVVNQFAASGTPLGPLTNIGGICCAAATNPILPGPAFYNPGSGTVLPAGVQNNWRQIFVSPYSFLAQAGVNINTANQFTFALHFTVPLGTPSVSSAISAGNYGAFPSFGAGSWIEIYGANFAAAAVQWSSNDFRGLNAPTTLSGTRVTIGGVEAYVSYVSPGQINVQVPAGIAPGTRQLVVTTTGGSSPPVNVTVEELRPGVLAPPSFRIGGVQNLVALLPDGTYVLPPGAIAGVASRRARPGETITFYGTGFGVVNPAIGPGQIAASPNTLVAPFTVSIGGARAAVAYSGLAPTFVGLYQFNVVVPAIGASDAAPVAITLGGVPLPQSVAIAVGN